MQVTDSTSSAALAATPKSSQLGQEDFLTLMITQFQNQDPFKPMENGDFLAQMAQFSTVSGLQELNDRFDTLAASISGDQALQAASLIGREILVSGDVVSLDAEGQSVDIAVVTQGAGEVIVDVKDDSGQLVRTLSLQADAAGNQRLSWDGQNTKGEPVEAGLYQFEARMNGGDAIGVLLAGRVDSVGLGGSDGTRLRTEQLGEVSMSAVRALY